MSNKPDPETARFDGETYEHERDHARLAGQLMRIFRLMRDGKWRTLEEIARITGDPVPSISTRLRDFRKAKFGGHTVNRAYQGGGLHAYQLQVYEK